MRFSRLAAHDPRAASEFVAATLGPLAEDNPSAARLYTHRNTVLKRIARATELLGYPPGERRLAVGLALELRRHLQQPAT